jgi:hypothetical protein
MAHPKKHPIAGDQPDLVDEDVGDLVGVVVQVAIGVPLTGSASSPLSGTVVLVEQTTKAIASLH